MLYIQKISDRGTSSPVIGRVLVQSQQLLQWIAQPKEKNDAVFNGLFDVSRNLGQCLDVFDAISLEVEAGRQSLVERPITFDKNRPPNIPGVHNLKPRFESFLQTAKLAIGQIGDLFGPYFGVHHGHHFHNLTKWAHEKFGKDDQLYGFLHSWVPFVSDVVNLRNCVDHPKTERGAPLIIRDFFIDFSNAPTILEPHFGRTGDPLQPLVPTMLQIVVETTRLAENIVIQFFYMFRATENVTLAAVPAEQQTAEYPSAVRVVLR